MNFNPWLAVLIFALSEQIELAFEKAEKLLGEFIHNEKTETAFVPQPETIYEVIYSLTKRKINFN